MERKILAIPYLTFLITMQQLHTFIVIYTRKIVNESYAE